MTRYDCDEELQQRICHEAHDEESMAELEMH
jgi:hypothetical protein